MFLHCCDVARSDPKFPRQNSSSLMNTHFTVHVVEVEPEEDNYESLDWNTYNDLTLSDIDSGDESVFEAAAEECLRGTPVFGPPEAIIIGDDSGFRRSQKVAYIVFNGREMGVFETW
jgi:hypothetical protein